MERLIFRGKTLIGRIIHPAESGAPVFGTDILALSEFGNVDPDQDTQFESSDRAEDFLHQLYEIHCDIVGVAAEPRPAKPVEVDEEAAYYAREAALEAEEYAHLAAQQFSVDEAPQALESQGEPDLAAPEQVEGDDSDDLPF